MYINTHESSKCICMYVLLPNDYTKLHHSFFVLVKDKISTKKLYTYETNVVARNSSGQLVSNKIRYNIII